MKNLIAAVLFLIQWQEYELKPFYRHVPYIDSQCRTGYQIYIDLDGDYLDCRELKSNYSVVETVEHSIKLKTREDVAKFIGKGLRVEAEGRTVLGNTGLIGDKAFNIQVKEVKE